MSKCIIPLPCGTSFCPPPTPRYARPLIKAALGTLRMKTPFCTAAANEKQNIIKTLRLTMSQPKD